MIRAQAPVMWMFVSMFLMLIVVAPACTGPSKRTKTIQTTLIAINAARDGFVAWDRQHQHELVETSTSKDEALTALDAYHKKRESVVQGFELAYKAVAVAATQSDGPSLQAALDKARELYEALKTMGVQ